MYESKNQSNCYENSLKFIVQVYRNRSIKEIWQYKRKEQLNQSHLLPGKLRAFRSHDERQILLIFGNWCVGGKNLHISIVIFIGWPIAPKIRFLLKSNIFWPPGPCNDSVLVVGDLCDLLTWIDMNQHEPPENDLKQQYVNRSTIVLADGGHGLDSTVSKAC